jgi:hypothetical protein
MSSVVQILRNYTYMLWSCTITVVFILSASLAFSAPDADEREYRLALTTSGYLKLKPFFQQAAVARTDLYVTCPECVVGSNLDTKIRLKEKSKKSKKKVCLQISTKVSEQVLQCKDIPISLAQFKQDEECLSGSISLEKSLRLGHTVLSQLQQKASESARIGGQEFNELLHANFGGLLKRFDLKKSSSLTPSHRNTKVRWYLMETDDALAAQVKMFLGITFYQDENGQEQTRYEVEAKQHFPSQQLDMSSLLCGFIERMSLSSGDVERAPPLERKFLGLISSPARPSRS